MHQPSLRPAVCCALLLAVFTWGCAKQGSAANSGCSGSCGNSPTQAPSTGTGTGTGTSSPSPNNNSALKGNYAFSFSGITGNGTISSIFAAVGRFAADGTGNLTSGEIDTNGVGTGALTAQSFTGTYTIGADNRGTMTMNFSGGSAKFAFAMTADGNARFIEFDASGGSGTIGSGTIEQADVNAFAAATLIGDYAFGLAGLDNLNNRAAIIGRFTSNGTGTLGNPAADLNAYGTPYSLSFSSATYTVSDTKTGRGGMNLAFTFGGAPANLNFALYIVNAKRLFVMERDTVTTSTPLLNGLVVQQQTPSGGFTNASLNGNMVIYLTGLSNCGSGAVGVPKAVAGLVTAGGAGSLNLDFDENYCHAPRTVTGFAGTYSVASNGRATIALAGYALVAYLANANQVFLFVSDNNVLFGFGEPQAAGSFGNTVVKGTYAGSATHPASFGVAVFSGEFNADGASPTGNLTGNEDIGAPSGPVSGEPFNANYSVTASPTNGRGTMTVSSGTGGNAVIYVISPSKFVALSQNDPNPAILVFEQSSTTATPPPPPPPPPAPTVTLSSLTLNPASVVGGMQSATGTVTLSGPAPSGGAQVTVSSNNSAASVPSSVTISAGATSATFTVNTSPVTSPASVTITASYGAVSKSSMLTVTPVPLPVVSSLTLSPSSVVGGLQSATGTVTLSGPVPASGAQVTLASGNSAATVPASVTIPAGATSAKFTVNTAIVVIATSATISASYNNSTQSAVLSILI
jgi:trimeric autotransporter adhesin